MKAFVVTESGGVFETTYDSFRDKEILSFKGEPVYSVHAYGANGVSKSEARAQAEAAVKQQQREANEQT